MDKQQSVMDIINIRYDSFFEQEKKIANYIMQHHKDVVNMTIGELAEASGASVATVSRFCRKCDVDGFHHLKISLAKEIVEGDQEVAVSNDISRKDIGQSLQNILANKVEELKQTVSLIDEKKLKDPAKYPDSIYNKELDKLKNGEIDGQKIPTLTIIIKATDDASYKNLVDALDEMQICSIGKYVIDNISPEDKQLLSKKGVRF